MAYTPINLNAFTSAYSGAISGMAVSGWITNPSAASYVLVTKIAGAFAKAFDQAWNNPTTINVLEELSIVSVCENEFIGRGPGPLDNPQFQQVSNWAIPAAACAALVLEGDAYFLSQGITPPPLPSDQPVLAITGIDGPDAANPFSFNQAWTPGGHSVLVTVGATWTVNGAGDIVTMNILRDGVILAGTPQARFQNGLNLTSGTLTFVDGSPPTGPTSYGIQLTDNNGESTITIAENEIWVTIVDLE